MTTLSRNIDYKNVVDLIILWYDAKNKLRRIRSGEIKADLAGTEQTLKEIESHILSIKFHLKELVTEYMKLKYELQKFAITHFLVTVWLMNKTALKHRTAEDGYYYRTVFEFEYTKFLIKVAKKEEEELDARLAALQLPNVPTTPPSKK